MLSIGNEMSNQIRADKTQLTFDPLWPNHPPTPYFEIQLKDYYSLFPLCNRIRLTEFYKQTSLSAELDVGRHLLSFEGPLS